MQLIDLHRTFGNQWRKIAEQMWDRSEQHLKNLFTTRKKAKSCGQEYLLHAYVHGAPIHSLQGLHGPLVVATVPSTRDSVRVDEWSTDVQLWYRIALERQLHIFLTDTQHPW